MLGLMDASMAVFAPAPRPVPPGEAERQAAGADDYVTTDVARADRIAAQRSAMIGFLHVGV